jgi:Tol biopolymer transport system component
MPSREPQHPAQPGQRVGHYEILSELGRGGMGIVYRARDLRLGREVALKCPSLGPGTEAGHRRFLREARAASQLSSPYIVPVFEVFEADGEPWLAMELVRGRNLRQELARRGALPAPQAVRHARDLAEALLTAHEKGILHRDVNPNNVLISPEGRARLMDFGLAKLYVPEERPSEAPTHSGPLTRQGGVMGTPGYMSPEQVLGKPLDPRSDIFSLGAVLYEMCCGRQAFRGSRQGGVVDAILHQEPAPLAGSGQEIPEGLERVVRKALAKNPDERYQHVRDLKADLHALHRQLDYQSYQEEHSGAPAVGPGGHRLLPRGTWVLVSGVLFLLLLVVLFWPSRSNTGLELVRQPPAATPVGTWPTDERGGRISPDRQWISFIANRGEGERLWVRRLEGGEVHPLTPHAVGVIGHAWSPDGGEIACLIDGGSDTRLQILPAPVEGRPRLDVKVDRDLAGVVRWIGSRIYLESYSGGLWRFRIENAAVEEVTAEDERFDYRQQFDVRPDEERVLFSGYRDHQVNLWTSALDGSGLEQLTDDAYKDLHPRWSGGGDVLYVSRRQGQEELWALNRGAGESGHVSVAGRIEALDDVSADGSMIMLRILQEQGDLWWVDPDSGEGWQLTADTLADFSPSVGGDFVAFQRARNVASTIMDAGIFVARWEGRGITEQQRTIAAGYLPALSPDGRRVAYLERLGEGAPGARVRLKDLESGRVWTVSDRFQDVTMKIFPAAWVSRGLVWAPDGSALFHVALSEDGVAEIRRHEPESGGGGGPLISASAPGQTIQDVALSPDGTRLIYLLVPAVGGGSSELRELDLSHGTDTLRCTLSRLPGPSIGAVYSRGFLADGESVLLLRSLTRPDASEKVEFLIHHPSRGLRSVAMAEAAYPQTAILDAAAGRVLVTMAEAGLHDIYALFLETGEFRRMTRNRVPQVSYSGHQVLADGTLLTSRHQRNLDLWLLEAQD